MVEELNFREFARRDGCDEKLVRRKVASGHLPQLPSGKIDAAFVGTAWRKSNADKLRVEMSAPVSAPDVKRPATKPAVGSAQVNTGTKAEAEAKKENYIAALRELEYHREAGLVVAVEDAARMVGEEYARVRSRLMSIPSRVAPRLAVIRSPEQIRAELDGEIALALQELSSDGELADPDAIPGRGEQSRRGVGRSAASDASPAAAPDRERMG